MSKASHLTSAATRLLANCVLGKVSAVIGATATAVTTTGAVAYAIDGVLRTLAALTNQALSAILTADVAGGNWIQPSGINGFYVQPAGTTVYYVFCVNSAGTIKVVQGTYQNQPIAAGGYTVIGTGNVPDVPDGWIPFTIMKLASGGATFTPGTTALTGLATFLDVAVLPAADKP